MILILFSLKLVDSRCVYHEGVQDSQINFKNESFFSLFFVKSISFSETHLKSPVGRYSLIAHPYKLFASRYVI